MLVFVFFWFGLVWFGGFFFFWGGCFCFLFCFVLLGWGGGRLSLTLFSFTSFLVPVLRLT